LRQSLRNATPVPFVPRDAREAEVLGDIYARIPPDAEERIAVLEASVDAIATPAESTLTTIPGTLLVGHGGTGLNYYQVGDLIYATTPTLLHRLAMGTEGQVLVSGAAVPEWESDLRLGSLKFTERGLRPLVTFMFDDGFVSDITIAKPVFDAQGEVACSAITSDYVDTAGKLTWAQVEELYLAGWEIVNHTKTHPNLTTLTAAQMRTEFEGCDAALEAHGITATNACYPFHAQDALVRSVAREYFRAARGGLGELNEPVLNTFALASRLDGVPADLAVYQALVDTAESENRWLILYCHSIGPANAAMYDTLIDYIQAKDIEIVTMDQALDLVENIVDVGDAVSINEVGMRMTLFGALEIGGIGVFKFSDEITYKRIQSYGGQALILNSLGNRVGIGLTNPIGRAHIDQSATAGNEPVLVLDQADVSEEFIRFIGTSANTVLTQSIVEEADVTLATRQGFVKIYVQDDGDQLADQDYFMPVYTLA